MISAFDEKLSTNCDGGTSRNLFFKKSKLNKSPDQQS